MPRSELVALNRRLRVDGLRYCTACERTLALTDFPANRRGNCRDCTAQYGLQYRAANADRTREYQRQYYAANAERERERNRQYREANVEAVHAKQRRYRETNAERERERLRQYREANRERIRAYKRQWHDKQRQKAARKVAIAAISAQCERFRQRQRDLQAVADAHERALERRAIRRAG